MTVTRREFIALSTAAAAFGAVPLKELAAFQAQPAPPAAAPATAFASIRGSVGYFTGRGGTIGWMSGPDALVVVDTQFPDTAKICLDGLRERSGGRVPDLVLNTHHHGDHTGGNGVFKGVAKKIVAHARVPELQKQAAQQGRAGSAEPVLPDETFDKVWSAKLGTEQVKATHYGPGHTGGDAVIFFEQARVAHMGDLVFHQVHPFVDRGAGASIQNWMRTLETVTKELPGDTIYIAGHARQGLPVTVGRADVLRLRDYFDAVLTHTRKAIAGGQSRDEIIAAESLPGIESYGSAPPLLTLKNVLGVAFDELSAR